jgi:RNA polymerase sigma-70 factor, ECF subfamily
MRDETPSDEVLMLRYRNGDSAAFDVLYNRYRGSLYRYLLRQCRIAAVAEELFQDIWMNLIRARRRYEPRAKFATYLFTLAHHRLIDYYRRQSRGVPVSYDGPEGDGADQFEDKQALDPEMGALHSEQRAAIMEILNQLPEAQREAFLLKEETGLSLEEIAVATGVNRETAKSRIRYAVKKLRQGLNDDDDES